ncbi:TPA: hypothetical protein ACWV6Y_003909 [Salmonella enterica subsp. enterica serovar Muenchen]
MVGKYPDSQKTPQKAAGAASERYQRHSRNPCPALCGISIAGGRAERQKVTVSACGRQHQIHFQPDAIRTQAAVDKVFPGGEQVTHIHPVSLQHIGDIAKGKAGYIVQVQHGPARSLSAPARCNCETHASTAIPSSSQHDGRSDDLCGSTPRNVAQTVGQSLRFSSCAAHLPHLSSTALISRRMAHPVSKWLKGVDYTGSVCLAK